MATIDDIDNIAFDLVKIYEDIHYYEDTRLKSFSNLLARIKQLIKSEQEQ